MKKPAATIQGQPKKNFPEKDRVGAEDLQRHFFNPAVRLIIVFVLFAAAFCVRIYHIDEAPLIFHPGRQYECATIARAMYFSRTKAVTDWQREMANLSRKQDAIREPPVLEYLSSIGYQIAGGERLWIPKLMSVLFWLTGGVFLYRLVSRIISADAAVVSVMFFLFLPYGVIASRSFQPNPLMIMLSVISITVIYNYFEQSTVKNLLTAAVVSSLTLFIYPTAVFPVLIVFAVLAVYTKGIWGAVRNSHFWLFGIISILPMAIYYFYAFFIAKFLAGYTKSSFLPHILLESFFWKGWLVKIDKVIGLAALIGGLLGFFMFPKGKAKILLGGLWLSYIVYALFFNYSIHIIDYYQLPIVPTIAISIGGLADAILGRLRETCAKWYQRTFALAVILFAVYLSIYTVMPQLYNPGVEQYVNMCEEIGGLVGHSTKAIFLTYAYGKPLRYHGWVAGSNWPNGGDFRAWQMSGLPIQGTEERFKALSKDGCEYFIVTDFQEFEQQQDLKQFLTRNFPLLVKNQGYLIFDLRKKLSGR
jgi:4-amino-4-deoxy-L-arabinose transferase-like glycosyltransferase